jgi:hypothetical protein
VINNISHYEKPSPLMEALVNDAGAEDLLDFYRLHQGGRKPVLIKMTLFGLYLIRYQPYLSILESF